MPKGELAAPYRLLSTPATLYTRELAFSVKVSVGPDYPAKLPILGATYSASKVSQVRVKDFGSYICTSVEGAGDYFWVTFSKNKTAAEANAEFKTPKRDMGNHYWHPILLGIDIAENKLGRTVNRGDRVRRGRSYTATPIWIPAADTGTLFILREYLSHTEFEIPQHPTPLATAVSFPVPGQGMFTFPECLHPEINIQRMVESEDEYDTAGATVTSHVGISAAYTFPATDPKTWLPYFLYDRQTKTSAGAWHRTQMEVVPPPLPRHQRGR